MRYLCPMNLLAFLFLSACSDKGDDTDGGGGTDDSGPGGDPPVDNSTYEGGKYRIDAFTILDDDEGKDWDEDGDVDNHLPSILGIFDAFLSGYDLSRDGLNKLIATDIAEDDLVVLLACDNPSTELSIDLLNGVADDKTGALSIDPSSYDGAGAPVSHFSGSFETQTAYSVGPDPIIVAIPVDDKSPPALFPVEEVVMEGTLDDASATGFAVGIVPVDRFVTEVLPVFVPAEGYDMNGDKTIDPEEESSEAITELVTTLLNSGSDVTTSDGRAGISSAFRLSAVPATF
jgi:hypothetical protein